MILGDCVDEMARMDECSIDAIVCDPPYALPGGFMAKSWDCYDGREDAAFAYWLAGLIDGEGCFTIKAHTRGTHAPAFSLHMRADEEGTLRLIERTLRIGSITHSAREPHPMVRWTVQDKAGCGRLVDLLDKYPLRAKKRIDYATWREAVCEWTSRPRGNRWRGAADNTRMAHLRKRLMTTRGYVEPPWSGHEFQDWCRLWGCEALRVLKPGGHLLAAGAPRSGHRLAAGLEDAGFEIRDTVTHMFGSGFPKSLNLSDGRGTALKPAVEFWTLARKPFGGPVSANVLAHGTGALNIDATRIQGSVPQTTHGVSSRQGEVYGHFRDEPEPSIVNPAGRWPANVVLSHSPECRAAGTRKVKTGTAVNRNRGDERPMTVEGTPRRLHSHDDETYADAEGLETVASYECVPGCPVRQLDEQTGESVSPSRPVRQGGVTGYDPGSKESIMPREGFGVGYGDSGGASRFFASFEHRDEPRFRYVAKASSAERNAGLDGFEAKFAPTMNDGIGGLPHSPPEEVVEGERVASKRNVHPLANGQADRTHEMARQTCYSTRRPNLGSVPRFRLDRMCRCIGAFRFRRH